MAVRLKDIARDLGISTVTVSKVLRGNKDVGEKTRARVLKRMQEVNYKPNMLARGLASGRTYTMGLVVPDLVHPFFAEFAKSIAGVLRKSHIALLLVSSEEDPDLEQQEIRTLLRRGVDVLMIASSQARLSNFYELGDERTPYLLVDRNFPYLSAHFVGSDDYKVGCIATEHLISIGRKRIAHIGGRAMSPSLERMRGYRDTLLAHRMEVRENLIVTRERVEETGDLAGREAMLTLLKLRKPPDAVFCYNDLTAIGAMEAVREAGLRIPEDIAFVGCGNLRYAKYLRTALTSVDQQPETLGVQAGELALELFSRPDTPVKTLLLEPRLIGPRIDRARYVIDQFVTISAATADFDATESQLKQMIDQKKIEDLPVNGRSAYGLVLLSPGITDCAATTTRSFWMARTTRLSSEKQPDSKSGYTSRVPRPDQ